MRRTELHGDVYSHCGDDTGYLSREFPRLKSMVRPDSYPDGINGHVSVIKPILQHGEHRPSFDLKKDELCQVYLPKTVDDCV